MSTPDDGGPAFPRPVQDDRDCAGRFTSGYGGMSLRAYFAGQAMQAMLANPRLVDWAGGIEFAKGLLPDRINLDSHESRGALVFKATQLADQLMASLAKEAGK
jgi:hypothetical protein